jgi:ketosteroid isomerase-like protein
MFKQTIKRAAAALALLAVVHASYAAISHDCPTAGHESVEQLATDWILVGWEKAKGDPPLDFRRKFDRYYDWSGPESRIYYDDFDPERRVVDDPKTYGAIWAPAFSTLRSARHVLSMPPTVLYGGTLAVSTLEFVALLEGSDGKTTSIRTLSTLSWRCTPDGWRIAREHNSSTIVPAASISAYFARGNEGSEPGERNATNR